MKKPIKTIEDVKALFKSLVDEEVIFHPDDDFREYVKADGKTPCWDIERGKQLNKQMTQAFRVCKKADQDIYLLGMQAMGIE